VHDDGRFMPPALLPQPDLGGAEDDRLPSCSTEAALPRAQLPPRSAQRATVPARPPGTPAQAFGDSSPPIQIPDAAAAAAAAAARRGTARSGGGGSGGGGGGGWVSGGSGEVLISRHHSGDLQQMTGVSSSAEHSPAAAGGRTLVLEAARRLQSGFATASLAPVTVRQRWPPPTARQPAAKQPAAPPQGGPGQGLSGEVV